MTNIGETKSKIKGKASVKLPPGMTQEEADRLVREADERTRQAQEASS